MASQALTKKDIQVITRNVVQEVVMDASEAILNGVQKMFDEQDKKIEVNTEKIEAVQRDISFIKQDISDIKQENALAVSRREFGEFRKKIEKAIS